MVPMVALAQTYPSPTFNGITLQNPLTPANGGTGVANSNTLTLSGNLSTTGSNPLTFNTTGSTNITLPTSGTLLNNTSGATSGANSNITSLSGLTTPLSVSQGGTGTTTSTGSGSTVLATSPTLSGTPSVPTATTGTNTTQIATTEFVAKHAPCLSVLDYGGNNGGTVDNSAALSSAIAAQPSGHVCVYFPPGKYMFSSTFTYTIPANSSMTILGGGADLTNLYWANGSGLFINHTGAFASVHIRDMSFLTGSVQTGDAITLNQTTTTISNPANTALSDITNVTCRGNDGYLAADVWTDCVSVTGVSNVNYTNIDVTGALAGIGVKLSGTASALSVVHNFQGCTFNYTSDGIYYGSYVQGVSVNQSNFTGGPVGIVSPTGSVGTSQLSVTNSQFNNSQYAVLLQVSVPGTSIVGNYIIAQVASAIGVSIFQPGLLQIVGNLFNGTLASGQIGINFNSGSAASVITGNSFFHFPTAIFLASDTGAVNVQSNAYTSNTVNVNNAAGAANTVGGGSP
jgi:hypothetical protein